MYKYTSNNSWRILHRTVYIYLDIVTIKVYITAYRSIHTGRKQRRNFFWCFPFILWYFCFRSHVRLVWIGPHVTKKTVVPSDVKDTRDESMRYINLLQNCYIIVRNINVICLFIDIVCTLGPACYEFGYNKHPVIMNWFLYIKLIFEWSLILKFVYNEKLFFQYFYSM